MVVEDCVTVVNRTARARGGTAAPVAREDVRRLSRQGFTMIELMVALALFAVLMSGVVMLFVGSVRSAKTSYQQIDAFEKGRSALTIVQNDLVTGISSYQNADLHNFYGTPIGMTFIAKVRVSSSSEPTVARVTYVVYNRVVHNDVLYDGSEATDYRFPGVLEDLDSGQSFDGYPYPLLRLVEPSVSDLNTFPIPWDASISAEANASTYRQVLDRLLIARGCSFDSSKKALSEDEREQLWSVTCELWIRMVAGGDSTSSGAVDINYWNAKGWNLDLAEMNPLDYMVTDNILSTKTPAERQNDPFCGTTFFDYDMAASFNADSGCLNANNEKYPNVWWNDARSGRVHNAVTQTNTDGTVSSMPYVWGCGDNVHFTESSWDPRLPEAVTMSFWLMFESPYPGAPDFQRLFALQINLPAAYARPTE